MTKNELFDILKERGITKTEFNRSFSALKDKMAKEGLLINKIGRGEAADYILQDLSSISDFRKPLIIRRDMHAEEGELCVNGIPQKLFEGIYYPFQITTGWFIFMNYEDSDVINFDHFGEDEYKVAIYLDMMMSFGFLQETDTNIIFYADNYYNNAKTYICYHSPMSNVHKRIMPIIR